MVGNYRTVEANVMATGPVTDGVGFRVSAGYGRRDKGYVDNVYTGKDFDDDERGLWDAATQVGGCVPPAGSCFWRRR